MAPVVWLGALSVASSVPIAWWAVGGSRAGERARRNLAQAGRSVDLRSLRLDLPAGQRVWGPVGRRAVELARRITPVGMLDRTQRALHLAGTSARMDVERVLAIKVLASLSLLLLMGLAFVANPSPSSFVVMLTMVVAAWILPDVVLRRRADFRQGAIRNELPDVMDQVMINVEAGQSFDAAMSRVANRGTGPAAEEFRRVIQDIRLGMTRREAFDLLLERTDVPELRETVQALGQAEKYGVPLGRVLRVQADELRDKRKQRAEERAMKIPVKILFPLMVCILPALIVVILGPGVIDIIQSGGIAP